jgi:hypothetical protein
MKKHFVMVVVVLATLVSQPLVTSSGFAESSQPARPSGTAVNRVLSLDGKTGYMQVGDSESLHSFRESITLEAWVNAGSFYMGNGQANPVVRKNIAVVMGLPWDAEGEPRSDVNGCKSSMSGFEKLECQKESLEGEQFATQELARLKALREIAHAKILEKGISNIHRLYMDVYEIDFLEAGHNKLKFRGTCLYSREHYNSCSTLKSKYTVKVSAKLKKTMDIASREGTGDWAYGSERLKQAVKEVEREGDNPSEFVMLERKVWPSIQPLHYVRSLNKLTIPTNKEWWNTPHHRETARIREPAQYKGRRLCGMSCPYLISFTIPSNAIPLEIYNEEALACKKKDGERWQFVFVLGLGRDDSHLEECGLRWVVNPQEGFKVLIPSSGSSK